MTSPEELEAEFNKSIARIKMLTPVGGWKLMMCKQVPFRWGVCDTPDGPIGSGTEECNNCRYNYDNDYIDGVEHD